MTYPKNYLLIVFGLISAVQGYYFPLAILHLTKGDLKEDVCAIYNPKYSAIPMELKNTPKYPVYLSFEQNNTCQPQHSKEIWNASSFIKDDGNCSFFEKLQEAYIAHAKQVILISSKSKDFPLGTDKQHTQVHLSVGTISSSSWEDVQKKLGIPEFAQLYHPHDPPFDPNLIVLWAIAVFTVVTGSFWSGVTLKQTLEASAQESSSDNEESNKRGGDSCPQDKYSFPPLTTIMVLIFIVMICVVLLLLYFFYKYLIYVVIGIFAIAAVQGTYDCLSGIKALYKGCTCRVPENSFPGLSSQPEVCNIILLVFCIGLSIFWIIIRNTMYGWILQDILGICFCISLLKMFKLPNLKISSILLMALLVYDIFFVFITPFFSAQGKSIMVEVATGRGSIEQLPMVIKVPKIIKTAMSICERPYSLLGFGDILLPGLFVAFCHNFDILVKSKCRIYFVATSVAYACGLIITFVALLLMKSGQPALLYLAPSVLIAAVLVGLCRKELKQLWTGQIDLSKRNQNEPEVTVNQGTVDNGHRSDEESLISNP